jgi:hypothetical protein
MYINARGTAFYALLLDFVIMICAYLPKERGKSKNEIKGKKTQKHLSEYAI